MNAVDDLGVPIDQGETPPELLASNLIDVWCRVHGRQIPWAKAIEIVAIITKLPEQERERLLALGDEA